MLIAGERVRIEEAETHLLKKRILTSQGATQSNNLMKDGIGRISSSTW
jgi:hypothetical protein